MSSRNEIVDYCNTLLKVDEFEDHCPNGLQVEGKSEINIIVGGVSACIELFEKAKEISADMILVHHGIIWYGSQPAFTGSYGHRIKLLIDNEINLAAYHLPLDGHLKIGNAAVLANKLDFTDITPAFPKNGQFVGIAANSKDITLAEFQTKWFQISNREPLIFPFGPDKIRRVMIATGGAQKDISEALRAGADLFITGEVNEQSMHIAKEEKIHFVSAGHHETEKFGILTLGDLLQKQFNIDFHFIAIHNPV